jgi:hypothetical protein
MKQIILHTGRCGSTKLWAILDRYYRAKYSGDNTEGSLKKLNRRYNLLEDNYFGLFEFYSPRFSEMRVKYPHLTIRVKQVDGLYPGHNISPEQDKLWTDLRFEAWDYVHHITCDHFNKSYLIKYPPFSPTYEEERAYHEGRMKLEDFKYNMPPTDGTDFIVLRRRNKIEQGISRWLTQKTNLYFSERERDKTELVERTKKAYKKRLSFKVPAWAEHTGVILIDKLMDGLVDNLKKVSKNIREIYYEDIENLKPYEVLEFMGITDYEKYLDKNFSIPFIKTWTR